MRPAVVTGLIEAEHPILRHRLDFAYPDISIADGIVVVLQFQRPRAARVWLVMRKDAVSGGTPDLGVVLHQHAVLKTVT